MNFVRPVQRVIGWQNAFGIAGTTSRELCEFRLEIPRRISEGVGWSFAPCAKNVHDFSVGRVGPTCSLARTAGLPGSRVRIANCGCEWPVAGTHSGHAPLVISSSWRATFPPPCESGCNTIGPTGNIWPRCPNGCAWPRIVPKYSDASQPCESV